MSNELDKVCFVLFEPLSYIGQSDRECLNGAERPLKVESVRVGVCAAELHHLTSHVLDLKVFGRFLSHTTSKIQLIHLTRLKKLKILIK